MYSSSHALSGTSGWLVAVKYQVLGGAGSPRSGLEKNISLHSFNLLSPVLFRTHLQVPVSEHYSIMKKSRHICAATKRGSVDILDSISLKVIKTWNTQSGYINDMDVQQDFIVTCGASLKQSNYMFDPYVNVFDLKNMQSMAPIPFPPLAAFVRMHPRMVTTGIVVSQTGQMHVVDLLNPNTTNVRQANTTAYLALVDISPSGQTVVIADSDGYLHLWASSSKQLVFAENIAQLEFPTDEQEPPPQIDWSVET